MRGEVIKSAATEWGRYFYCSRQQLERNIVTVIVTVDVRSQQCVRRHYAMKVIAILTLQVQSGAVNERQGSTTGLQEVTCVL